MLSTLPLIQAKAIHRQIGDHVRELIISGKLAPEAKLPTTEELAASWGSNPTTIQNALAPLVKEGLLNTARGVVTAVREKQVRVPNELKLALSKIESIDLFCPMPATFIVASEQKMARTLIEQVQKQFRGESCERIALPFKIVAHNNP